VLFSLFRECALQFPIKKTGLSPVLPESPVFSIFFVTVQETPFTEISTQAIKSLASDYFS